MTSTLHDMRLELEREIKQTESTRHKLLFEHGKALTALWEVNEQLAVLSYRLQCIVAANIERDMNAGS